MKPSGCAAQTVIHMGENGRLQVRQEKLLFKVVQMGRSVQTWSRDEEGFIHKQQCNQVSE